MDTPLTLLKSTGMSFLIFWGIILTEDRMPIDTAPYIFLSIIPIFLCCMTTICLTVAPFFWSKKKNSSLQEVYSTYFPFYAIVLFTMCVYGLIVSSFEIHILAFIASAFFTLLRSWSWLAHPSKTK